MNIKLMLFLHKQGYIHRGIDKNRIWKLLNALLITGLQNVFRISMVYLAATFYSYVWNKRFFKMQLSFFNIMMQKLLHMLFKYILWVFKYSTLNNFVINVQNVENLFMLKNFLYTFWQNVLLHFELIPWRNIYRQTLPKESINKLNTNEVI